MTHEYIIATNGRVEPSTLDEGEATAVCWAADAVIAVGPDAVVRAVSRGDSTFLDLCGCLVTPLPEAPSHADSLVREERATSANIAQLLVESGLLLADVTLEPGAPADLAFWDETGLVAIVRGGHFADHDDHHGPFPLVSPG